MKKDPAFLFYSKDWLSGTAEMMPDEKGVYIDLIVHQHQSGSIPIELERVARIVGLNMKEFNRIWKVVGLKFYEQDGRLFNKRMSDVMSERKDKGIRNRITGTFAAVLRTSNLNKKDYSFIRQQFKIEDWLNTDSERLTECLTEWLQLRLNNIGNGDVDSFINTKNVLEKIDPTPYLAEGFNTPRFLNAWNMWLDYRKEAGIKNPYYLKTSISTALKSLRELSNRSPLYAINLIEYAIGKQWQGIYAIPEDKEPVKKDTQQPVISRGGATAALEMINNLHKTE